MKIGFDAKRAFLNGTGLGNYSRWLINGLAKYYPYNQYFLYTPDISRLFAPTSPLISIKTPTSKFLRSWWRSRGIIKDLQRDDINIYHGLSHELPYGISDTGIKSVVTVHDVIVLRFPQYFSRINRILYKKKLVYACAKADKIVAMSQRTKDDLTGLLNIQPEKIAVIYQGCDPTFKIKESVERVERIKKSYNLPDKHLLTVGTIEKRKNLLLLIKALIDIPKIQLVVVGKPTRYLDKVKEYMSKHDLSDRVIFLHNVPFADLPAIYRGASCFIYPSRYEGFGIPVLEALVSGTPVIAAKGSCLEEAGGPDSLYADPDNAGELAEKINQVLDNSQLRQKMIAKGLAYSANFDDEKLVKQYVSLYKTVLNNA